MNVAKESPRFVDDVLYWYAGNTWDMTITFTIYDESGQEVVISPTDVITVNFKKNQYDNETPIKQYVFTNIQDNTVVISMDTTTTALFPRGRYVFGITYEGLNINTIIAYNDVKVEATV